MSRPGGNSQSDTILIIGSGSTALALAAGLRKNGIRAIVFEKDASLTAKERDWNMGLHWGAPVLQSLVSPGAWDRIQSVQVDPNEPIKSIDTMYFLNGKTGETMGGADIDNFYRLKRSKLRALLAEDTDIRFSKRLVGIAYSSDGKYVTAKFEDGSSDSGRLLIGADGARSATRRLIVGSDAALSRPIPFAATFIQASFTREQAIHLRSFHPLYLGGIHPNGWFSFFGIQDATDASRPETWIFFSYISWPSSLEEQRETANWTREQRLQQVKKMAEQYEDPWKSAFAWIPDNHPVWYMGMTDWDPGQEGHAWSNHGGRVTIAGDAAHTMTYQRGQGLNHSITDAAKLLQAIKTIVSNEKEQAEAIKEYEDEMISRAGTEVRLCTQNTGMLHNWELAIQSPVMKKGLNKG